MASSCQQRQHVDVAVQISKVCGNYCPHVDLLGELYVYTLMKIYYSKCMVFHGVLKQVNDKYHGILWNTIVYFHKGMPAKQYDT